MAESIAGEVTLDGVNVHMLQHLIDFIYSGVLQGTNSIYLILLGIQCEMCDSFHVPTKKSAYTEIKEKCKSCIVFSISVGKNDVPELAMLTDMLQLTELKETCVQLMSDEIDINNCLGV